MTSDGSDALAQSILDQVNAIVEVKLGHELGLVTLHSLGADYQHARYFLTSMPFCQQLEYLPFPVCQLFVGVMTLPYAGSVLIVLNQVSGHRWGQKGISTVDRANTGNEL